MKLQVVVVGLGRFGSRAAEELYNRGHDVLAIDVRADRVQEMMGKSTFPVTGDGANEGALQELGVGDYNAAIVAIGSDIVSSVHATVLLSDLGVPTVIARARDQAHGNILLRIGASRVIYPEEEMGASLGRNLMNSSVEGYLELTPDYGFSRIRVPDAFDGKTVKDIDLSNSRDKSFLTVIAIRRGRDVEINPNSELPLKKGDVLILAGKEDMLEQLLG